MECAETEAVGLFASLSPLATLPLPLMMLTTSWETSMNQSSPGRTLQKKSKNVGLLIVEAKICEKLPHGLMGKRKPTVALLETPSEAQPHVYKNVRDLARLFRSMSELRGVFV
jgi:hypothetical protein